MNVLVTTPAPRGSTRGNQVTADRWAGFLRQLGHRVRIAPVPEGESVPEEDVFDAADLLIVLHARKGARVVGGFHRRHPGRPLVVALTGTDLYGDVRDGDPDALRSLELAWRLIVLHPKGLAALPASLHPKTRVIVQSSSPPEERLDRRDDCFEVCVSGHLRPVKDPFRTAEAVRSLPPESRIQVTHIGAALGAGTAERAREEAASNPRYTWLGEVPRGAALQLQARARLLVLTSRMEGGANVLCEALAATVPVLASRVDGSVGLLGEDYPGYFPVGDTAALTRLLAAAETDEGFYGELRRRCENRRHLVDPAREQQAWDSLLRTLAGQTPPE